MIDSKEALRHVKTLAVAGRDADSEDMMHRHFSEIIQLVENALDGGRFQPQVGEQRRDGFSAMPQSKRVRLD